MVYIYMQTLSRMTRYGSLWQAAYALGERIPEVRFRGATTAITENNPADQTPANAEAREEKGRLTRCESALLSGAKLAQGWTKTNFYCRRIRTDSGTSPCHVRTLLWPGFFSPLSRQ